MSPSRVLLLLTVSTAIVCAATSVAHAQSNGRTLGREDIRLLGAGLSVEPARQVVPKDIATIVSTFLSAPDLPDQPLPPFAPDALVKATLRGPSFSAGIEITARPNTPFNIPPLSVAGIHTLDGIRLESGGEVILRGAPETVVIEVIEKLLVTQVTARPLTAQEIRDRGIVFDRNNFQAYNFTAAFAIGDANPIPINFAVVLPTIQQTPGIPLNEVGLPRIDAPMLPSLQTIIPDTLQLQAQIPNLSVVGFTLTVPELQGQNLVVPPIPGIVVIPGDIGFLNQYFNVTLLVGNVAPAGSGLVVTDLSATIVLPPGRDAVPNSGDDPLRMAQTVRGESPRIQLVVQPGADGRLGTADDIGSLGPGDSGGAEYLVEGRREGSHVIEMEMAGTLNGLPVGPVTVRGRAAGSVLVRNPTFTLTFTHPELINAGEAYTLDVTVTNTSESPANFVSVNLHDRNVTGAIVVGEPTRDIEHIAPGDAVTVSFDLIAQLSGPVTAATLDSDQNVEGRFALKTTVGELGIPLSPDSLVLPKEASSLPAALRTAALGLLGRAWAVATAPAAALPADVSRFTRKIVFDRAIELAEAGFRYSLHEPLEHTATHLLFDYLGNVYERLPERNPEPGALALAQSDYRGFDELRRRSIRGEVLADAVSAIIGPGLAAEGAPAFHRSLGEITSFRAGHVSVLAQSSAGPLPFTLSVFDAAGRRVGGRDNAGRVFKTIPFSDLLSFGPSASPSAAMAILGVPQPGDYRIQLDRIEGAADTPFTLSILVPDASGALRHLVFQGLTADSRPNPGFTPADPIRLIVDVRVAGATTPGTVVTGSIEPIADPAPRVVGVVQQKDADVVMCEPGGRAWQVGRVIAVLFSEEVTPEAVQDRIRTADITRYLMDGNQIVSVALQPGRRIAFLALRDPVGPLVPRTLTISEVTDRRGQPMPAQAVPIEMTVDEEAAVVSGQVLRADGTPAAFTNVRLFYVLCGMRPDAGISPRLDSSGVGISSKMTDADGRFSWDFVLKDVALNRIAAVDVATGEARTVPFTIARNGQRLSVNVVFLGRGSLSGRTVSETGTPLPNTSVKVTSLTDDTEYGATSDAEGRFTINRIPVGNMFIEAVNPTARATGRVAEYLSIANATLTRDVVLFSDDEPAVEVQFGSLRGFVLSGDGLRGVADVPVIAWYQNQSQRGVTCPRPSDGVPPAECAIAVVRTSASGEFLFDRIAAGRFRVTTLDRATYQQGEAAVILAANTTQSFNILLAEGLGTIRGVVLDAGGARVAGARVGGGLSLTTTNDSGEFVLVDVPVGRREIVAVSDALQASGRTTVDLVRAGDEQNVTIIFEGLGSVAGRVFQADGVTPIANARVHVFKECVGGCIEVVGSTTTDANGGYSVAALKLGGYRVSSFRTDFTAGNVTSAAIAFNGQVARADVVYRGGGGRITGVVYDDDGQTPLPAAVGISGDRVAIAGGQIGVGFQHVTNYEVTQTNFSTGAFAFDNIWVGPVTLRAVGQFSPDPIPFETAIPSPGATVHVELRLQGTAQLSGTVFQPDGVTPAGADVIVRFQSDAFKLICNGDDCARIPQGVQDFTVVTDAQGRYLINPVNAGPFTISVEDPATGRVAQLKGDVKPAQDAEFAIRLLQLATVTIRVRGSDGVTPIGGARVELRQTGFPERQITLFAGANGDAVFSGGNALAEGEFAVLATNLANGFAGRVSGVVTAESQAVSVNLFLFDAYGSVAGIVFAPDGLTPVPNVEVLVRNDDGPLAFAVTDGDGRYLADIVPLGDVHVEAFEAATARRAFASGRIDFDDQAIPINLSQLGIGQVTGTLYQAGSLAPLKNWDVSLTQVSPTGHQFPLLRTSTGIDGTFSFPGATVGAFTIHATKVGVAADGEAEGDVVRHGQVVDVPLVVIVPRAIHGRIEGRVVNADGTGAASPIVTLTAPGLAFVPTVTAGTDGRFTFESVPVGRLMLRARSQASANEAVLQAELQFEGETLQPTIVLVGLTRITGTVYRSDGVTPASFVALELHGIPSSGCPGPCLGNADAAGRFAFDDVPARSFTVVAIDEIAQLKGVVGDVVNPGETRDVRIVLEPSAIVTGRVLLPGNRPAQGVVVDVVIAKPTPEVDLHLFAVAGVDGVFRFPAVPSGGPRTFNFADPIGPGVAARSIQVLDGTQSIGDIVLDVGPPAVTSTLPPASATGVALNAVVRVSFSEPVAPGSVTQANVTLTHGGGAVPALLSVDESDTRVNVTPLAPLLEKTLYTLTVRNLTDRIGKPMTIPFVTSFTSVDLTPPAIAALSPGANANGAPIYAPVRVTLSEPIDVSRFTAPALALFDGVSQVAGQIDFAFGNTVVVFTPLLPLREDATYRVTGQRATDLSGNTQPQGLEYTFTTTDRTPPIVTALVAAGNGTVIENAVTHVVAQVGANHDVAFVDFYVNGVLTATARTEPFTLNLLARPDLAAPGQQIAVAALATDTSGNRGTSPVGTSVTVIADTAAVVTILAPAPDTAFRNGERVNVTVRVADDLGATQLGYRAETGRPQDAATIALTPPQTLREETFGFNVPQNAAPGSRLRITASALDTKGQAAGAEVSLVVLDAVAPTVTITGTTTGSRVRPGQDTLVVVSAQDAGAIRELSFEATGVVARSETRLVDPAQVDVATSFTIHVPETAHAGDLIVLRARAIDVSGNSADAAPVTLPVADLNAPTVIVRTATGSLQATPGQPVTVIVDAEDETGVSRIDVTGQGAFTLSDARAISPPIASASASFTINVPASAVPGAALTLAATATDLFGNVSQPGTLLLTIQSVAGVTMPASLLTLAGDETDFTIELAEPAPAGGLSITLSSTNANVALPLTPVTFAAGETTRAARLISIAGGNATINAFIQGVQRASTTVTVQGGVVRGTVFDPNGVPVAGAQVSVTPPLRTTITDANGDYLVQGIATGGSSPIVVKVLDPVTRFIGYATGQFNVSNGSARLNAVLIAAGRIGGTVRLADGETIVGAGVRVDLLPAATFNNVPLQTVFTGDDGAFEFPLVTLGTHRVDASDTAGNRGRATAVLAESGDEITVAVQYLGRGIVTGTVRSGGSPVPNAALSFYASSIFGNAPPITRTAEADGTFRFEGVLVGSFTVQAHDGVSNTAGTASGQIAVDAQTVTADVSLASYGGLTGRVFRSDGASPVVGATIRVNAPGVSIATTTDENGDYSVTFIPLGSFSIEATEPSTRGIARVFGSLTTHLQVQTHNLTFLPQGTVIVTVRDFNGNLVPGAHAGVSSQNGSISDSLSVTADANGIAIFERVLAGTVRISAFGNGLSSPTVTRTLAADEVIHVTVTLEPSANLIGTLFGPDGQTPVTAGFVGFNSSGAGAVPVGSNGTFRFDGLDFGTYRLYGFDATGRLRAIADPIVLDQNGIDFIRNLTLAGVGSVIGQVVNPDGSPAGNLTVTVRALAPQFGGFHSDVTDANGNYEVFNVVAGPFSVATGTGSLLGEATGTIVTDGEVVRRDIALVNSAVQLPVLRRDANNGTWEVRQGGQIANSMNAAFVNGGTAASPQGGFVLEIVSGGTTIPFVGDTTFGTTEDGSREVVVRQQTTPVAGLSITRKAFVPRSHFARYIELLTNPTAAPITVDVRIRNNFSTSSSIAPELVATSSGDAAFDLSTPESADRWAVVRFGADGDVFANSTFRPSYAWVFDGPGAATRASTITLQTANPKVLAYTWSNVTIQPGQTVGFIHFGAQQYNQAAAVASAERLAQLPPEALVGLSPNEIASIRNFVVPVDGTSTLDPLPAFGTTITGRLLEADGTTAIPTSGSLTNVRLRSSLIYFGRLYTAATNTAGLFTFTHSGEVPTQVSLPQADFTVDATYVPTGLISPPATGSFGAGELTATRDILFSNGAVVTGLVRRHTGAIVTIGGTMNISNIGGTGLSVNVPIAADGRYRFTAVRAGSFTLFSTLNLLPGGVGTDVRLTGSTTIATTAGQVLEQDVLIVPTGGLTGTLRSGGGTIVPNRVVQLLQGTTLRRTVTSSTAGVFVFADVPVGTYTLRSQDPISNLFTQVAVVIVQDQTTQQDLTYIGLGTVPVTVTAADGVPLQGATIRIRRSTDLPTQTPTFAGTTNASGQFTIPNVPVGNFLVQAFHPLTSSVFVDTPGSMPANGAQVPLTITLAPVSSLLVQVRTTAGAPVPGAQLYIQRSGDQFAVNAGETDAAGDRTVTAVYGSYTLTVQHPVSPSVFSTEITGAITASNLVIPIPVVMPFVSSVIGTVRDTNGNPVQDAWVSVYSTDFGSQPVDLTNSDGEYEIDAIPPGPFVAWAEYYDQDNDREYVGVARGIAVAQGEVIQVDIVLDDIAPPVTLVDGNARPWEILNNGAIYTESTNDLRYGLTVLTAPTVDAPFFGRGFAESELDGRQLSIWQPNVGGVLKHDVTRRVYVPGDGYFVRYLDVFENTGTTPWTVRAGSFDEDRFQSGHELRVSSSGDLVTTAADHWWVTGVAPVGQAGRAYARVLSGAGGAVGLAETNLSGGESGPEYRWSDITLQPGERAAILHFAVESRSAGAAQAVAERLVQLPPEAIAGLAPEQLALVRNFDVPDDGVSLVAAFPTFSGRVLSGDTTTPVAGATVTLTAANVFIDLPRSDTTDALGRYTIPYPAIDDYVLSVGGASTVVTGEVTPGVTSIVHDIVLATAGGVRGVVRFGGVPVATGEVRAIALSTGLTTIAPIQPDGTYQMAGLEQGAYTLVASSAGRGSVPQSIAVHQGVIATHDLNLTLFAGTITVRVLGADGSTTIPTGQVFILDASTSQVIQGPLLSGANGTYVSTPFAVSGGFRIRAEVELTSGSHEILEVNGAPFSTANQVVPFTLHSTAPMVSGTVYDDDEDPLEGATVVLRRIGADGLVEQLTSRPTVEDGRYAIFGVGPGPFVVKAYAPAPSLITAEVTSAQSGPTQVIDFALPEGGEVEIDLFSGARVTLTSAATDPGVYAVRNVFGGSAFFEGVPVGPFSVQACSTAAPLGCAAANGIVTEDGDFVFLVVPGPFDMPGTFVGTLLDTDGVTPLSNREVRVAVGDSSPVGGFETLVTDAAGQFRPGSGGSTFGRLVATSVDPAPAFVSTTLAFMVQTAFNLIVGSGVGTSHTLQGTLGFQYPIGCDGALMGGGAAPHPFAEYSALRINGLGTRCHVAARAELDGRQIVYGPITMGGLEVTRKVLVPADGGYVRYLEILTNVSDPVFPQLVGPVTTEVQVYGRLVDPITVVQSPATTGHRYYVADGANAGSYSVAEVVAGTGAVAAANITMQSIGGVTATRYTVTVPEGESRIVMHFVAQRAAGDHAGAAAQAQSLITLTDPNMLTGLTAAERARIVNFVVP